MSGTLRMIPVIAPPPPRTQKGITLIELIVALTLGSFVIAALMQVFAASVQTYHTQEQASQLQDKGRFVMDALERYVRLAGYRSDLAVPADVVFPADDGSTDYNYSFDSGQVVHGIDGTEDNTLIDSITFRYQGDAGEVVKDCAGRPIGAGQTAIVTFYLSDHDSQTGRSFSCRSLLFTAGDPVPDVLDQPMIDGVEDMEIRYGINTDFALHPAAKAYLEAAAIDTGPPALWGQIVSVQIALLLHSEMEVLDKAQSYFYPPWDGADGLTGAGDRRLRRVFTADLSLRNRTH